MLLFNNEKKLNKDNQSTYFFSPIYPLWFKKIFNFKFTPLKVTGTYIMFGSLWIILIHSFLIKSIENSKVQFFFHLSEKWLYFMISALILYLFISYKILYEQSTVKENKIKNRFNKLKKVYKLLKSQEERYRLAIEGSNDAIWDWYIEKNNLYLFVGTKKILEFKEDELENTIQAFKDLIHPDDIESTKKALVDHFKKPTKYYKAQYRIKTKSGNYKWILSQGKAIYNDHKIPIRMVGFHKDITFQKQTEEKIYFLAYYDSLTGLPNRALFEEKLSKALKRAKENNFKMALLYFDLDNFKNVNDTLGHMFGDLLLKNVGELIQRCLGDIAIVSRMGGDEFVVLFPELYDLTILSTMIEKIIKAFQNPWILDDREFYITPSIGVTIYPDHGITTHDLMKNADTAMYYGKDKGKNSYYFYNPDMNKKIVEKLEMENNLRHAIEREEFLVYYQPLIDFNNGKIVGVEALIRWFHPTLGFIPPSKFIPIVEESGLIIPIGEWVLRTACNQYRKWKSLGCSPLQMSVNLSTRQFQQDHLVEKISSILDETGMDPQFLELEITETLTMKDLDLAIVTLKKLRRMGIKVSLDDFGTGYSSLNYLKKLPIDTLKIDQSFVQDITKDKDEKAIARAVMTLAHSMNLKVTAEGVENWEQFSFLKTESCDKAQGYLFSKPLPSDQIEKLINQNKVFI